MLMMMTDIHNISRSTLTAIRLYGKYIHILTHTQTSGQRTRICQILRFNP